MSLLSVIIPTYNRRDLLRQTLETVLSQPGEPSQIVVVDDGSTDGTLEMLQTMSDRVTALRQSNGGPGAARNRGAAAATGEYLAFLDSDDLWFPWTAATYRRVIELHDRPAFVAGKPFEFKQESELSAALGGELATEAFADYYASGDEWRWWGASSFVVRRQDFQAAGGYCDAPGISGEDCDLALKLGTASGFVQIRQPATFGYRWHPGNLTNEIQRCRNNLRLYIRQEQEGRYPGGTDRRFERWRILTRHTRSASVTLAKAGYVADAWSVYRDTARWNLSQMRAKYLVTFPLLLAARLARPGQGGAKAA